MLEDSIPSSCHVRFHYFNHDGVWNAGMYNNFFFNSKNEIRGHEQKDSLSRTLQKKSLIQNDRIEVEMRIL